MENKNVKANQKSDSKKESKQEPKVQNLNSTFIFEALKKGAKNREEIFKIVKSKILAQHGKQTLLECKNSKNKPILEAKLIEQVNGWIRNLNAVNEGKFNQKKYADWKMVETETEVKIVTKSA